MHDFEIAAFGASLAERIVIAFLLIVVGGFFVAAEYALIGSRKARLLAMARSGSRLAEDAAKALDTVHPFIAATQIGVTLVSVGIGALVEPTIANSLQTGFGIRSSFATALSIALVTFVAVTFGELLPKYLALSSPETAALITFRPLRAVSWALAPAVWLSEKLAAGSARIFGVSTVASRRAGESREDLKMLLQSVDADGDFDPSHAAMIGRALQLDQLSARDVMVHRLDVRWVNANLSGSELLNALGSIPHGRVVVCRDDLDDLVGILFVPDAVRRRDDPNATAGVMARQPVAVPETLTLDRVVQTMRDRRTQILIVRDEYGGTSGILTLEDVVEEIFGDLEDTLEAERPSIEMRADGSVSARAAARFDELVAKLGLRVKGGDSTETLAQMIVDRLGRVPLPGDSVQTKIGILRVERMTRRRITRVSIALTPDVLPNPSRSRQDEGSTGDATSR